METTLEHTILVARIGYVLLRCYWRYGDGLGLPVFLPEAANGMDMIEPFCLV